MSARLIRGAIADDAVHELHDHDHKRLPGHTGPQALAESLISYLRGVHDPDDVEVRVMQDHVDADGDVAVITAGFAQHTEVERDTGTLPDGTLQVNSSGHSFTIYEDLPDWVTEPAEPDFSDPIAAHDEEAGDDGASY